MNVERLLKTKGSETTVIAPEDSIAATAHLLAVKNKGLALVCGADDRLLGVVSVIDISRAVGEFAERAPSMAVESVMTTDYAYCRAGDDVEDGALKGLLNMRGVLEARFEEAEMQAEEMRKYIFGLGYH
ncbi:MAG: CBS domain-containing protein [Alphaproteobacteria bacterium]|jgi:CBS domain-containing protein|nr:CBS domain-containing protein [Alphaproteobacteria bacterium]